MDARIKLTLKAESIEEAQKILNDILEKMNKKGAITDYSFEIVTDSGVVTEKCIFSGGKVIA